ncbi:MAG: hypothetical protein ACPLRM_03955 [Anaerolineae bacterium]
MKPCYDGGGTVIGVNPVLMLEVLREKLGDEGSRALIDLLNDGRISVVKEGVS